MTKASFIQRTALALLCAAPFLVSASASLQPLLDRAELVRSSDPALFNKLLADLVQRRAEASAPQREKLDYLRAYADVYAGRCGQGIAKSESLIRQARDPDVKSRSSALIVNCLASTRQFLSGLRELDRLTVLTSRARQDETRQHALFASANLYNQVGQYRLGLRDVTRLLEKSGWVIPRNRCFAEQLRLDLLERLGETPHDDASVEAQIDRCIALHEPMVANFGRIVLAHQEIANGQRMQAESMLREHLSEVEKTRYPRLISETKALLAELRLGDGDLAEAQTFANQAIQGGSSDQAILPLVTAHHVLYEVAERRGDPVGALSHFRAYADADKAYLNEVKTREIAYQIVKQESQEKNQEIELLNRRNKLLQLQQRVDSQKAANSRLLMLLFAVFAMIIAYWGYKTRRLHASLRQMAQTDALTGICNRHHFAAQAQKTLVQCEKDGEQVSLIMFDLDHFKAINDSYGHVTGDWVLREVSRTCAELCRRMDFFGRLGGEEFAILLHGCDLRAATRIAEDCRMRIARLKSAPSGYNFPITASFGVSCSTVAHYDLDKLLSQADQMLYRAKREGRNRVKAFAHDLPAEMREPAPRRDEDDRALDTGSVGSLNA